MDAVLKQELEAFLPTLNREIIDLQRREHVAIERRHLSYIVSLRNGPESLIDQIASESDEWITENGEKIFEAAISGDFSTLSPQGYGL